MNIRRAKEILPLAFKGLSIVDYTAQMGCQASFAKVHVPSLGSHPQTWSPKSEKLYFVLTGAIQITVEGVETKLEQGDLCWIKIGQKFSYMNPYKREAVLILVHAPAFDLNTEIFDG